MRAQLVYEALEFERGRDPKAALDIGMEAQLDKFIRNHFQNMNTQSIENLKNDPDELLKISTRYGFEYGIQKSLQMGAKKGENTLEDPIISSSMAPIKDKIKIIQLLLRYKDQIYDNEMVAQGALNAGLRHAVGNDNLELAKLFLDNGANWREVSNRALRMAKEQKNAKMVSLIQKYYKRKLKK